MSDEKTENRVVTFIMSRGRTVALRVCKIIFEESIAVIDEILAEEAEKKPEEEKDIEPETTL